MEGCTLCPRRCGVDRRLQAGYCGGGSLVKAARAAKHLWELLGIAPERVYVAGDGPNDVQLLRCARHSCAPADACPEILSIARHILPEHRQHAIAALIRGIEKGSLL